MRQSEDTRSQAQTGRKRHGDRQRGGAISNPAESPAAQTAVGKTPAAALRSIASFFFFQPAAGERGTPAETIPSAAVHDTAVRTAEARPTESTAAETLAAPHPHPKRKPANHQHPERDYC